MKSFKNELIWEDIKRWGRNTLLFTTPALIVFLTALSNGKSLNDALMVMYPAFINLVIDLLRKYRNENKY